jgi:hypothetical protein
MAARTFRAPDGRCWQAWYVDPREHTDWPARARRHLPEGMANGWLCFEAGPEKRRLLPVPPGWETRSEEELWSYCCEAEPVRRAAEAG